MTLPDTKLVERLRDDAAWCRQRVAVTVRQIGRDCEEAQTEIERLTNDLTAMTAERDRMREALETIAQEPGPSSYWLKGVGDIIISAEQHCGRIARQALSGDTNG